MWVLSHTPHGGVLLRRAQTITRTAQYKGENSADGISTAERFSCAPTMAPDQHGASPCRSMPPLRSGRRLRHREVGWEAPGSDSSVWRMTNAMRRDVSTSLRRSGEVCNTRATLPWRGKRWPGGMPWVAMERGDGQAQDVGRPGSGVPPPRSQSPPGTARRWKPMLGRRSCGTAGKPGGQRRTPTDADGVGRGRRQSAESKAAPRDGG
jgi:hypothetical protein